MRSKRLTTIALAALVGCASLTTVAAATPATAAAPAAPAAADFTARLDLTGRPDPRDTQDPSIGLDAVAMLAEASGGLPVLVKGVLRGDDALACLDAGAAGVVVSNHGGRQLDRAAPTAEVLAEVADAVGGRVVVLGLHRGEARASRDQEAHGGEGGGAQDGGGSGRHGPKDIQTPIAAAARTRT